jgi:integrase
VLTLKAWIAKWLTKRAEAGHDWKKDRGRLDKHVLPVFGSAELTEVTTAMIADLVHDLRFKKKLANRTVRNIYSVLAAVFRDARIAGHVQQTPCILRDEQLGRITDKDPEWRTSALFARDEVESMISDARIPQDRQLVYGFGLLAGLRPGEGAALRWRHYEMREPLGCLKVAKAYSTSHSKEKGTKTDAVRHVPVHPVLAEMLAQWRAIGWPAMFGRAPEPDDLIVPLPPDGEANEANRRAVPRLGLHRPALARGRPARRSDGVTDLSTTLAPRSSRSCLRTAPIGRSSKSESRTRSRAEMPSMDTIAASAGMRLVERLRSCGCGDLLT